MPIVERTEVQDLDVQEASSGEEVIQTIQGEFQMTNPISREEVQETINTIVGRNLQWDENVFDTQVFEGNVQKSYVIREFDEKIVDGKDFYFKMGAATWKDDYIYLNHTRMRWLQPVLEENDFKTKSAYQEYKTYRTIIEQTVREKTIEVENGKVLEYQQLNWVTNGFDYFHGTWDDTLLIYKIYCSPALVVYLRPEWERIQWGVVATKMDSVYNTWDYTVQRLRPMMLNRSNEVLKKCAVNKAFFDDIPTRDFDSTQTFAYYYKIDLEQYWNLSTEVSFAFKNDSKGFFVDTVNVTFHNNDEALYGPLVVEIMIAPDGKNAKEFVSDRKIAAVISQGETVEREIRSQEDIYFKEYAIVDVRLMREEERIPVRPKLYTVFKDGNVEKR